ncbi:hypothetical protein YC2023_098074 [Brassica napus]
MKHHTFVSEISSEQQFLMGSPLGHRTSSMILHLLQSTSRLQVGAHLHAIHRGSSGIALLSSTARPCSSLPLGSSLAVGIKPRRCRSKGSLVG